MRERIIFSCVLLFTLLLFSHCGDKKSAADGLTIAVIPKATSHIFWQSIHAGAVKAEQELGVKIVWVGTEKEDDRQQQIALVDNQVMNQVNGIVLAPLDGMALRRPVKSAVDNAIPVVIIDSDLIDSEDVYTSFVATDNLEGGRLAGQKLAEMLNGSGKVVLLRYMEGSASTENREAGFLEALKNFPNIEIVSQEQHGGATVAQSQQASENLLLRFKDSAGKLTVDGIFCPNESTTYGMLQALQRQRLAGTVKFIGFDANEPLIEGLKQGELNGLVLQDPVKMGYLGVVTMVRHLRGELVAKRIDTGVTFVTATDLARPEIQELVKPDLARWLKQP